MTEPLLRAVGLRKRFGEVAALRGVSFDAASGEIHVLAGENGAGKTTLVNILSGLYRADAGEILFDGRSAEIRTPADAVALGIGMVHQHSELVLPFTALENIVLGREGRALWLRPRDHLGETTALADRYGLRVPLDVPVRDLSVGERQKVEILKTLSRGVRVLILDEPTTLLTPQEVDALFQIIRSLTRDGLAVVFITHKLREALGLGDRISVLRGGQRVATVPGESATETSLVNMMFGSRAAGEAEPARPQALRSGDVALAVLNLTVIGDQGVPALRDCTFEVAAGEIAGIAGVTGNGQRELAEAVIGAREAASGAIVLFGREVTGWSIDRRLASGLAFVPEDRIREGILPSLSLAETLILGLQPVRYRSQFRYDPRVALGLAAHVIAEYGVAAPNGSVPTATLSGGNIQKVLVARALLQAAASEQSVLVAANPTRGLDVAASAGVHHRMLTLRGEGRAVLLISEDLDELMALCDRILVLHRGRIAGALPRGRFDAYALGAMMAGALAGR